MDINIVFFVGYIETLDYFVWQLYEDAKRNKIECYMADARFEETYCSKEFYTFIQRENCIFITFNQIGTLLYDSDNNNIWEKYCVPIYDIVVDHPRNFASAFINPLSVLNVLCIDRNHIKYIKEFYPKVQKIDLCPHGGTEEKSLIPYSERKIDVLYMGSCQQDLAGFPVIHMFEDGGRELYSSVIDILLRNNRLTVEDAIKEYLISNYYNMNNVQILELYDICALYIETYIRRYYKQIAIRELDKLGINVEIYGDNWESKEYSYGPNIKIHSRITSKECNDLAGDAKICLNFMPWFKDGTSERVFNAMLNKSVCVSDTSIYLEERFTDGENIIFFDLNNPLQMAYDIKFLLDNPAEAQRIAQKGYEIAKEQCTWEHRLKEVLDIHNKYSVVEV